MLGLMPIIQPMQPYDGNGYLCYVPDGLGGNVGFGQTPEDARKSWEIGEDIGEAAARKWAGRMRGMD